MADFLRMQQAEKIQLASTVGSSHSGNVGLFELEAEDASIKHTTIITEDAYTETEWNGADVGTHIWSIAAPATQSWKTGATSWVTPTMA